MQLSIFELDENNESRNAMQQDYLYSRWRVFEFLEENVNKQFLLKYEDNYFKYSLPFRLGEMKFNSFGSERPKLVGFMYSGNEIMRLGGGELKEIRRDLNDDYAFFYEKVSFHSNKSEINPMQKSKVGWIRDDSYIEPSNSSKKNILKLDEIVKKEDLQTLIASKVFFKVRFHNDIFSEILSSPVVLTAVRINEDKLIIEGHNSFYLKLEGLQRIRMMGEYLLLDVYNKDSGYSQSIYIYPF